MESVIFYGFTPGLIFSNRTSLCLQWTAVCVLQVRVNRTLGVDVMLSRLDL
jgi:hypothetical protein